MQEGKHDKVVEMTNFQIWFVNTGENTVKHFTGSYRILTGVMCLHLEENKEDVATTAQH
jgi:hypothetical protein